MSQVKNAQTLIIPYRQHFKEVTNVPFGVYRVLVFDIEKEGHLTMPIAKPAVVSTVIVLGSPILKLDENKTNDIDQDLDTSVKVDISDLTLRVNLINVRSLAADNYVVTLSSSDYPDILVAKIWRKGFSKSLVYNVEPETNYTIIVFSANSDDVLNSSIWSTKVYVGMLVMISVYTELMTRFPK